METTGQWREWERRQNGDKLWRLGYESDATLLPYSTLSRLYLLYYYTKSSAPRRVTSDDRRVTDSTDKRTRQNGYAGHGGRPPPEKKVLGAEGQNMTGRAREFTRI